MAQPFSIAFIHPELGIGGSERLVLDAAAHLQSTGHRVAIFTARHERANSFEETTNGSLDVRVHGAFIPLHVRQRLRAPCAIVRMHYLAARVAMDRDGFDVIFCDVVPHAIPAMRLSSGAKIIFYCHFPDRLLVPPGAPWYRCYRAPIDGLEEITTGMAHRILVNSRYTAAAFRRVFPRLQHCAVDVVYPGVDVDDYDGAANSSGPGNREIAILSIGRYEPGKNVQLAIESVALLRAQLNPEIFDRIRLVVAGGYDERRAENRETLAALQTLARRRDLERQVWFLKSVPESELRKLLWQSYCLVHTATQEHFGYAPLEAMAAGRPVVVVNCGGPAETVLDRVTGFVRPPTPSAFADALAGLIKDPAAALNMGRTAREHVAAHFSRRVFGRRLELLIEQELESGQ